MHTRKLARGLTARRRLGSRLLRLRRHLCATKDACPQHVRPAPGTPGTPRTASRRCVRVCPDLRGPGLRAWLSNRCSSYGVRRFSAAKSSAVAYVCVECGKEHAKWAGKCTQCGEWNTLEEVVSTCTKAPSKKFSTSAGARLGTHSHTGWVPVADRRPVALGDVPTSGPRGRMDANRLQLSDQELNRVLGGGVVRGSVCLLSGSPGVGKSTLTMQIASMLASKVQGEEADDKGVLYVSGEETAAQLSERSQRLGVDQSLPLLLWNESSVDAIVDALHQYKPRGVIVDSIQTMVASTTSSSAGSVTQIRESASMLLHVAKSLGIPIFMVGHVTKSGQIAGPKLLEHLVDCVLYLEGDEFQSFRVVRVAKNRFGPSNEVAVYSMEDQGLVAVKNPALHFLRHDHSERQGLPPHDAGSSIAACVQGSRVLMLEVQALTTRTYHQLPPRHRAIGVDTNRFTMICAVLQKHLGFMASAHDVQVNVIGGFPLREPASDLAVACAVLSSYLETPLHPSTCVIGELGLAGEVRPVVSVERRVAELAALGFERCIVPRTRRKRPWKLPTGTSCEVVEVATLQEAARACGVTLTKRKPSTRGKHSSG